MKNINIEVSGTVKLLYDENSPEFKEALAAYTKVMDRYGGKNDMLKHAAFHITRFGIESMVEGVGYVLRDGYKPTEQQDPFSGIWVVLGFDDFYFEIE